jgi:nucleoside-diphosphate-sugar epimerase
MRVFVTGATGFIGSAVVADLLEAGHQVLALVRSDSGATALANAGVDVLRGSLEDLESLRRGASASDGVVHTAFVHDFSNFLRSCEIDKRAIETMGEALAGSNRPLVVSAGTLAIRPGRIATEDDAHAPATSQLPRASEYSALATVSKRVRASVVRLSIVHGDGDHGLIPALIAIARERGVAGYIGDGGNRWGAVERLDAARLFRLALEWAPAGSRWHAVAEEGIRARDIAAAIGRALNVPVVSIGPERAQEHFGWIASFFSIDGPASSAITRERLRWNPTHRGLIDDLDSGNYFAMSPSASAR